MSDQFWIMVGIVLPIFIVQCFQYATTRANARKSESDRREIKAQVAEVKDQIDTVKLTKEEMQQIMRGRERQIMVAGIEEGRRQATGPVPMGK